MKLIAVDIGKGTEDIVIPLNEKREENWPKLIIPSPTEKLAREISKTKKDITVCGYTMGGGPVKKALIEHLKRGFSVKITPKAAKTIRDDLEQVRKIGFEVTDSFKNCDFFLSDLNFEAYQRFLWLINENLNIKEFTLGIACQDHGFVKGQSDRVTRFKYFQDLLERERNPKKMVITQKTGFFSRFDSILEQLSENGLNGFVMDSKIAAVAGMVDYAQKENVKEFVVLDIGNGHTLGASVKNGEIVGLFEHHTKMLNREKIKSLVEKLVSNSLSFDEVFEDGGHGALTFEPVNPEKIYVVGPNRNLFKDYGEFAYPLGDSMLYGCAGIISAFRSL
jgi:uncharacterized protein (DUF1786 family)